MLWLWIVLGIVAYLNIGYNLGRLYRHVYMKGRSSGFWARLLFPVRCGEGTVGQKMNGDDACLVHRDNWPDRTYFTWMSIFWPHCLLWVSLSVMFYHLPILFFRMVVLGPNKIFEWLFTRDRRCPLSK